MDCTVDAADPGEARHNRADLEGVGLEEDTDPVEVGTGPEEEEPYHSQAVGGSNLQAEGDNWDNHQQQEAAEEDNPDIHLEGNFQHEECNQRHQGTDLAEDTGQDQAEDTGQDQAEDSRIEAEEGAVAEPGLVHQ